VCADVQVFECVSVYMCVCMCVCVCGCMCVCVCMRAQTYNRYAYISMDTLLHTYQSYTREYRNFLPRSKGVTHES